MKSHDIQCFWAEMRGEEAEEAEEPKQPIKLTKKHETKKTHKLIEKHIKIINHPELVDDKSNIEKM